MIRLIVGPVLSFINSPSVSRDRLYALSLRALEATATPLCVVEECVALCTWYRITVPEDKQLDMADVLLVRCDDFGRAFAKLTYIQVSTAHLGWLQTRQQGHIASDDCTVRATTS